MSDELHFALLAVAETPAVELPCRGRVMPCGRRHYSDQAISRMLALVAAEGVRLHVETVGEERLLCWSAPVSPPVMLLKALGHVSARVIDALEALGYAEA